MRENLIQKKVSDSKIKVVYNWADESIYYPAERIPSLGQKYGLTGKFNVMYTGNVGAAQALDVVVTSAALLRDYKDIQLVIIGEGIEKKRLRKICDENALSNVVFLPTFPPHEIPHFCAWADVLILSLKEDPLFSITVPTKTFSYLACGKPVLCAANGETADIIRHSGAGITCEPENPVDIAGSILKLYNLAPAVREAMGYAARELFLEKFSLAKGSEQYEKIFLDL
jgi:glycosyltransferase involved in cell wall biosynthesis